MKTEKTLLIITPSEGRDCVFNILVAATGEGLASHFCSSEGWAYNDLYGGRKERIKEWTERFGEIEVKFIKETDITIEKLLERNKEWYEQTKKAESV